MRFIYPVKPFWILGIALILISNTTKAYVPSVEGLAQLVTAQHGKGIYQIQQKIFLPDSKYTLYETWYVKDNLLKLKSSYKNTFSIYSSTTKKVWQGSQYFTSSIGPYFYQRFFLSKNSKNFFKILKKINLSKLNSSSHLLRYNGKPQYVINNLANISQVKAPVKYAPNIIIDNLRFYIQQILFNTNAFIQAANYKRYANNLWFPKNIQVFFNKQSITISTIKIKPISAYQFNKIKYTKKPETELTKYKASKNLLEFLKYFR